jgi:hypothetical protein
LPFCLPATVTPAVVGRVKNKYSKRLVPFYNFGGSNSGPRSERPQICEVVVLINLGPDVGCPNWDIPWLLSVQANVEMVSQIRHYYCLRLGTTTVSD